MSATSIAMVTITRRRAAAIRRSVGPRSSATSSTPSTLCRARVGVAGGGAARGLVVDRRDHGEAALAARVGEDAGAGGRLDPDERLGARVAQDARLRVLVHERLRLRGGREHDPPLLVEDADPADARLAGHHLHGVVGGLPVVGQHGVPGGGGEAPRELVGAHDHGLVVARARRRAIRTIPDTTAISTTRATSGTRSVWLSGRGGLVIGHRRAPDGRGALTPPSYPRALPPVAGSNGSRGPRAPGRSAAAGAHP